MGADIEKVLTVMVVVVYMAITVNFSHGVGALIIATFLSSAVLAMTFRPAK